MARKKSVLCATCGTKHYLCESNLHHLRTKECIYFCSDVCRNSMSESDLLFYEVQSLFKSIINIKTMSKQVKGYIRNQLTDNYSDENKRQVLLSILCQKKEIIGENISKIGSNFPNTTIKCKYVFKSVEKDVELCYNNQKEQYRAMKHIDIPIPIVGKSNLKKRDITKFLN